MYIYIYIYIYICVCVYIFLYIYISRPDSATENPQPGIGQPKPKRTGGYEINSPVSRPRSIPETWDRKSKPKSRNPKPSPLEQGGLGARAVAAGGEVVCTLSMKLIYHSEYKIYFSLWVCISDVTLSMKFIFQPEYEICISFWVWNSFFTLSIIFHPRYEIHPEYESRKQGGLGRRAVAAGWEKASRGAPRWADRAQVTSPSSEREAGTLWRGA